MKIRKQVKTSLAGVMMPQKRKDAVWDKIIAQVQKEEETSNVRQRSRRWMVTAAAVVAVAAIVAAVFIPKLTATDDRDMVAVQTTDEQPEGALQQTGDDEQSAGGEYETVAYLKNVMIDETLSASFPETIAVLEDVPIEISNDELATIVDNLTSSGWTDIEAMTTDTAGLYFFGPDDGEPILETEPKKHEAMVQKFMDDSGLAALLEGKGMTLEMQIKQPPENITETTEVGQAQTLLWSVVDGMRASGYVRISVSADAHMLDCKIYAVKSTPLMVADTVPLTEAVEDAFFVCSEGARSDDGMTYVVINSQLVFMRGIPLYELSLTDDEKRNRGTAYALAVDESVIAQNETAAAAYEQFLTYGF